MVSWIRTRLMSLVFTGMLSRSCRSLSVFITSYGKSATMVLLQMLLLIIFSWGIIFVIFVGFIQNLFFTPFVIAFFPKICWNQFVIHINKTRFSPLRCLTSLSLIPLNKCIILFLTGLRCGLSRAIFYGPRGINNFMTPIILCPIIWSIRSVSLLLFTLPAWDFPLKCNLWFMAQI